MVLENTPTPHFEQPLKFITHGRIFESPRYYSISDFYYSITPQDDFPFSQASLLREDPKEQFLAAIECNNVLVVDAILRKHQIHIDSLMKVHVCY